MEVKKFEDLNLYLKGFEIESIGNQAVRKAQEENRKKGIPLVYSVDGKIYYELADGTITTNSPFDSESKAENKTEKEELPNTTL
ncbi:MAG: hypothetical protein MJ204_10510 [Bacteroidales bacterium]|nr:hypothetical protein [Bacteroidales bacterium]